MTDIFTKQARSKTEALLIKEDSDFRRGCGKTHIFCWIFPMNTALESHLATAQMPLPLIPYFPSLMSEFCLFKLIGKELSFLCIIRLPTVNWEYSGKKTRIKVFMECPLSTRQYVTNSRQNGMMEKFCILNNLQQFWERTKRSERVLMDQRVESWDPAEGHWGKMPFQKHHLEGGLGVSQWGGNTGGGRRGNQR